MAATEAANNAQQRYAVVTGANKGIGLGICEQLAAQGIVVVLTARDEKRGLDALNKLKDSGCADHVLFHQLDVTDFSSVASLAEFINNKFGKIDILINNAGVSGGNLNMDAMRASETPHLREYMTQKYESAAECIQINYYGAKRMTEAFIPLLQKSQSPRVVNVSSSLGQLKDIPDRRIKDILSDADNLTEEKVDGVLDEFLKDVKNGTLEAKGWSNFMPAYRISKAAMTAYTRITAKKYPHLKVNCVCPGYVKTDLNYNTGMLSIEEGAASPVRLALLPDDGPSGLFFIRSQISSF